MPIGPSLPSPSLDDVVNISRTAEHALRAVLLIAQRDPGALTPAHKIAIALGAPPNYMAKTLGYLARAGILEGVRGAEGGYRLSRSPATLTLAEIIDSVDQPHPLSVCLLGDRACNLDEPCRAHELWSHLRSRADAPYRSTTVADLLGDRAPGPQTGGGHGGGR